MDALKQERTALLKRFHALLDELERRLGGARRLKDCNGRMDWPRRGVYFFREPGEMRAETGAGPRIVRVGTHAVSAYSRATLWNRLKGHKGNARSDGGNHRGSIFRLRVGASLMARDGLCCATWGEGNTARRNVRDGERALEAAVSSVVGDMPFLWLAVDDEPSAGSLRGTIERNALALLSNYRRQPVDPPSAQWLGSYCDKEEVRESGLWNSRHVDETYDPQFLDTLEQLVESVGTGRGR